MALPNVSIARLSPLFFKQNGDTIVPVYIIDDIEHERILFRDTEIKATKTDYSNGTTLYTTPHMHWKPSEFAALPDYAIISEYTNLLTDDQKRLVGLLPHANGKTYHTITIDEELKALEWFIQFKMNSRPNETGVIKSMREGAVKWLQDKQAELIRTFHPNYSG